MSSVRGNFFILHILFSMHVLIGEICKVQKQIMYLGPRYLPSIIFYRIRQSLFGALHIPRALGLHYGNTCCGVFKGGIQNKKGTVGF